jgi:hypothetical protein
MKRFSKCLLIFCGFLIVGNAKGAEKAISKGPEAFVPNADYEFQVVLDGTKITHDFVIQNKGDAVLKVEKVETT